MSLATYWLVVPLVGIALTVPLWAWLLLTRPRSTLDPRGKPRQKAVE